MQYLPGSIKDLINHFTKLPGIGPKSAGRLTYYLLTKPDHDVDDFGKALINLKKKLQYCHNCHNYAEEKICRICANPKRNPAIICVVEQPLDVVAIEKTNYNGLYHVLHGVLTPIEGIGPEHLTLENLRQRVNNQPVEELIIATNPNLEGEATAIYIQNMFKNNDLKITRLAQGLPIGTDLEYADEITLSKAFEGRK
jgi:recombination protein RecR